MVEQNEFQQFVDDMDVPEDVHEFIRESILVLPGESEAEYLHMLFVMIIGITSEDSIEWRFVIDLASLWWEIQRYRNWKIAILKANRADALVNALYKSDPNYLLLGPQPTIHAQARVDAEKWLKDDHHCGNLNVRLKEYGFNAQGINAHAFVQALPSLTQVERFLSSARNQVNVILRKINFRREFARRAKRAMEKRLAEQSVEKEKVKNEVEQVGAE